MANLDKAIYNIAGVPNEDFIEEVTELQPIKKNEIFFALLVDGLAGDPAFGVGLGSMVGEENTVNIERRLKRKVQKGIPEFVDDVALATVKFEQSDQALNADLAFIDLVSNDEYLIPLGFNTGA